MRTSITFGPALVAGLLLSGAAPAQVGDFLLPRKPVPVRAPPPPSTDLPTPASPVTVGTWAAQTVADQETMIVASVEGILLASSGPGGDRIGLAPGCLAGGTPVGLRPKLLVLAERAPTIHFTDAVRRLSDCGEVK